MCKPGGDGGSAGGGLAPPHNKNGASVKDIKTGALRAGAKGAGAGAKGAGAGAKVAGGKGKGKG